METVKMYGPAFDKDGNASGELVNRDVPVADITAYAVVGYKHGALTPEILEAEEAKNKAAEEESKAAAKEEKAAAKEEKISAKKK